MTSNTVLNLARAMVADKPYLMRVIKDAEAGNKEALAYLRTLVGQNTALKAEIDERNQRGEAGYGFHNNFDVSAF